MRSLHDRHPRYGRFVSPRFVRVARGPYAASGTKDRTLVVALSGDSGRKQAHQATRIQSHGARGRGTRRDISHHADGRFCIEASPARPRSTLECQAARGASRGGPGGRAPAPAVKMEPKLRRSTLISGHHCLKSPPIKGCPAIPPEKHRHMHGALRMDLTGHHSNPSRPLEVLLNDRFERAGAEDRPYVSPAGRARPPTGSRHRRHDWVLEAVIRVLAERKVPMRARDVHRAVEALLGEPVRWGSVKKCLSSNVTGVSARFVRVARGRYAVSPATADAGAAGPVESGRKRTARARWSA